MKVTWVNSGIQTTRGLVFGDICSCTTTSFELLVFSLQNILCVQIVDTVVNCNVC